jgi:adenylate kinase
LEYTLNLGQVKDIYRNCYFEIDSSTSKEDTVEEMARLLKFKIRPNRPNRTASILVCGPPGSGRSSLGKMLAKKYGFVYVSSESLLSDHINRKTEVGRIALNAIKDGELVGDDIMNGIIHNRISQVDCHLQGFVLEGFPKTEVQINSLPDLKI